jgi:nuclear GTP-binding protein
MSKNPKIINPNRDIPKGTSHMRSKSVIKRLEMYKKKAMRDKDGKFLGGQFMSRTPDARIKRIAPDRRWFGNVRTATQKDLTSFREDMAAHINNPYSVLMRSKKVPLALLTNPYEKAKMNLLTTESFQDTFGKKRLRKKPRLPAEVDHMAALLKHVDQKNTEYSLEGDSNVKKPPQLLSAPEKAMEAGTSKRIWQELYKVIDSSDVLIQVLDVRDPMGTRCKRIEDELKTTERRHKHLVFVLNKVDLVPVWVTARWVKVLSKEYPTLAFHASITNPFGKGSLLQLLKQFSTLHKERKQVSVGFIGYPNVGKSSIINTLKKKKVCKSAPVPGETKIWQYVTLFKRIFLIDCPGVVYPGLDSDENLVLKGVVRIETLSEPAAFVADVLRRVKPEYITRHYGIPSWSSALDFLEKFAVKSGKMLKGAEPDVNTAGRMVLNDFLRGRLPYFELPPITPEQKAAIAAKKQLHVEQMFNKIAVRTKFNEADLKAPEGCEVPVVESSSNSHPENPSSEINEDEEEEEEEGDEADVEEEDEDEEAVEEEEEDDEEDGEELEKPSKLQKTSETVAEKQNTSTPEDEDDDDGYQPLKPPDIPLDKARDVENARKAKKAEVRAADWDAIFAKTKPKGKPQKKRKR